MTYRALLLVPLFSIACSSGEEPAPGGGSGDGDTAAATGGSGENVDGDVSGSGGDVGTGGSGSGAGSSEGSATGGGVSATGGGEPGTGGGSTVSDPVRSSGCDGTAPQAGARTIQVDSQQGDYILSLPSGYDPGTTYPLGFAFHGFGRTHENCQGTDCAGFQSVMGEEAVLVYMKSFAEGWEQNEIREQNVEFFVDVLNTTLAEACIDESRVFVAGTSSGAHFTNVLACRFGDRLQAAAPVAGYLPESENCVGQVAAVPIHGIDDPHVTFESGETARDFYLSQNGCSTTTEPDLGTMHSEIRASRDIQETNYGCVDYQGCDAGYPVRWCEHSQGGYDNSTHGWPSAGGQIIWDFVSSL